MSYSIDSSENCIRNSQLSNLVGGGFRVGNSCTPVVDSCQCMAKPIQYCKVKKIKFKLKKKRQLHEAMNTAINILFEWCKLFPRDVS